MQRVKVHEEFNECRAKGGEELLVALVKDKGNEIDSQGLCLDKV